jgi:hypothetical protein
MAQSSCTVAIAAALGRNSSHTAPKQACFATAAMPPHSLRRKIKIPENQRICVATWSNKSVYLANRSSPEEVPMPAIAEVPTDAAYAAPRGSERPVCLVCADTMVAAEASAFVSDEVVSYLWTCDTCGYGLVTKYSLKPARKARVFTAA